MSDHEAVKGHVKPSEEEKVIEAAVVENEVEKIDPEGARAKADTPILARGDLKQDGHSENQS
jgi:hypothetical protein